MFVKIKRDTFRGCKFPILFNLQKTYPVDRDFQEYKKMILYSIAAELGIDHPED